MSVARLALVIAVGLAVALPASAQASWGTSGMGSDFVRARSMPAGNQPTTSVSNRNVVVSWVASNVAPGVPAAGYRVRRYDSSGNLQSIGSPCAGTMNALTCTEQAVPAGNWRYAVLPAHGTNWLGAESPRSTAVTVAAPVLAITSSTTVISLPSTLNGTISNFIAGQTVSFRLDDPATGPVLTGTISPTPVQASGNASLSVTIPAGTANGSHTVYAIGSQGDLASAAITVSVPVPSTITTQAWDVRDASSGTETNVSAQPAFAGDGLTFNTGPWTTTFGTTRYADFDMNGPLPATAVITGASFNFSLLAAKSGDTACFYFEVRRASTNALVSTHGTALTPTACNATSTPQIVTTAIPAVALAAVANDLRIRVYARQSGSRALTIDLATVTGTAGSTPFTLHMRSYTDATSGSPVSASWGLSALDNTPLTSTSNWAATFSATRSVKFGFPAYVPSAATVTGATLVHAYRSGNGASACIYVEIYAGATLIGTHGSAASPLSCNATGNYLSNTIALPEITTAARANSVVARIYANVAGNGTRTTLHDVATLSVTYTGG